LHGLQILALLRADPICINRRISMQKSISAALAALALGLGAAAAASAQTASPQTTPAAPATDAPAAKSAQPSVDWTIEDLLADPGAKSVLAKDLPSLEGDPRLDMVKAMSLRAVAQFPEAQIDQAKLDAVQADLAALPAPKPAS
jgi:hypothetical protein